METKKNVAAAFVAAQREFKPVIKNAINPHFRNRYADLGACIEAVQPALNKHGLAVSQETELCDDGVIVSTHLIHESGERLAFGKLHVPASKQDAQGYGSCLTYARRYSISCAFSLASEEDEDGNAATASASKAKSPTVSAVEKLAKAKDLPSLAKIWGGLSVAEKKAGVEAKDKMKAKLDAAAPTVSIPKKKAVVTPKKDSNAAQGKEMPNNDKLEAKRGALRELLDSADLNHGQFVEDLWEGGRCEKGRGSIHDLTETELDAAIEWRTAR